MESNKWFTFVQVDPVNWVRFLLLICGIIIKSTNQQPVIWALTPNLGWPSAFLPADITPSTGCSACSVYFIPHRKSDTFLWRCSMTGHLRAARLSDQPSTSSPPPVYGCAAYITLNLPWCPAHECRSLCSRKQIRHIKHIHDKVVKTHVRKQECSALFFLFFLKKLYVTAPS